MCSLCSLVMLIILKNIFIVGFLRVIITVVHFSRTGACCGGDIFSQFFILLVLMSCCLGIWMLFFGCVSDREF